jgi:hypothetical protein
MPKVAGTTHRTLTCTRLTTKDGLLTPLIRLHLEHSLPSLLPLQRISCSSPLRGLDGRATLGLRSLISPTDKPPPSGCNFRLTSGKYTHAFSKYFVGVTNRMQLPNYHFWWKPVRLGSPRWRIDCGMCYFCNRVSLMMLILCLVVHHRS